MRTAHWRHPRGGRGFTLLEMLVAVAMLFMLLMISIPGFSGYYADKALTDKLTAFHQLALDARALSMESGAPTYLMWVPGGVRLMSAGEINTDESGFLDEEAQASDFFPVARKAILELRLPYSLATDKPDRWAFWPSGNCEPAEVRYEGPEGEWTITIDPMSADYRITNYDFSVF